MLKLFVKKILLILLLMNPGGQLLSADVRNYQYDGKLPFVQMMLDMMSAMGIIDRVPVNGNYGRYGASRYLNSPWSRSFLQGNDWNDGGWGDNGLGGSLWDDKWGNPTWGVLPPESYASNGWVDETWEDSPWNPQRQSARTETIYDENNISPSGLSPPVGAGQPYPPRRSLSANPPPPRQSNNLLNSELRQRQCVTADCGLKKPDLNGLWVSETGEMLGIKDNSYLWSDGDSRYLTGRMQVQNKYLLASIDGYPQLLRFKYKYSGDHLVTRDPNGKVREFMRMSAAQYYNSQQGYGQNYYRGYN